MKPVLGFSLLEYILFFFLLSVIIYLFVYFYRSYKAYRVFLYYLESNGILKEMRLKKKPGPLMFLSPRIHGMYVSRILELEFFYDFVNEVLGLDLSSVRRDYFSYSKEGVVPEVIDLGGERP
jgi:hypothetical protein